jgi:hypothetical protein
VVRRTRGDREDCQIWQQKIPALFMIFQHLRILVICIKLFIYEEMECWFDDGDDGIDSIGPGKK